MTRKIGPTILLSIFLSAFASRAHAGVANVPHRAQAYTVLAWNDLGMHCYNPDFRDLAVLPPHNNLWAQVIRIAEPPQVVTSGVTVEYQIVENTYSAGKTNFWNYAQQLFRDVIPVMPPSWRYAQQLFAAGKPLPANVGLTGKGLAGRMDPVGDHFEAAGIPLTEYGDLRPRKAKPFQLAYITVKDTSGKVLATTVSVAPVSSELHCDNCHADDGDATTSYPITPTGKVETNILALHDYLNLTLGRGSYERPLLSSRPVLCANCHGSNALGLPGRARVSSLANAMHNHHQNLPDITPDTNGCYNCHPGPKTQCLRDAMSQQFVLNCTTCHGVMADLATKEDPWLNEPRCDSVQCHGPGYLLDQPLYRYSSAHGGIYCEGCHDSTHAIAPSREFNDGIKFEALQGSPGALRKCTACHAARPTQPFRHRPPRPESPT